MIKQIKTKVKIIKAGTKIIEKMTVNNNIMKIERFYNITDNNMIKIVNEIFNRIDSDMLRSELQEDYDNDLTTNIDFNRYSCYNEYIVDNYKNKYHCKLFEFKQDYFLANDDTINNLYNILSNNYNNYFIEFHEDNEYKINALCQIDNLY